ncbi:MAG: IclR family transcriptional regulator [Reyranellaceae bacterium]
MVRIKPKPETKPPYFTATLGKGLDALEALAEVEDASLTELARRLNASNATLFRILATLAMRGYVQKLPHNNRYRLTLRSWELGARAVGRLSLREVALPPMQALAREVNESPHLAVLEGDGVVIVEKVECAQPVRVDTYVGQRAPAHCSALGKIVLAHAGASTIDALFEQAPRRFTLDTVTDRAAFDSELAKVRRLGYAVNRGEWREGVCAVAVPLADRDGAVRAGLSLTMPTARFSDRALEERFVPALQRAEAAIGAALGR